MVKGFGGYKKIYSGAKSALSGGGPPRYLRKAGTHIMKNIAHAGVRASDKLLGGKIKIPKYLRKAGTAIGKALVNKGTELAVGALMGAGPPRYLRKAGTHIMKNLAHAGVRASDKLLGGGPPRYLRKAGTHIMKNLAHAGVRASDKLLGGCSGSGVAQIYDPTFGRFLQGAGFVPN